MVLEEALALATDLITILTLLVTTLLTVIVNGFGIIIALAIGILIIYIVKSVLNSISRFFDWAMGGFF